MGFTKKNYGQRIAAGKNAQVTGDQVQQIAAVGSIVFIAGTRLWHETHNEN